MTPEKFPEKNRTLAAPDGMDNCGPLDVYADSKTCLSCWRLSWRERLSVLFFGRVWLWVRFGGTQPPVSLLAARTVFEKKRDDA